MSSLEGCFSFSQEYFSYLKEAAEEMSLPALGDTDGDQVDGQGKETLNTDDSSTEEGEFLLPTQFLQVCCLFYNIQMTNVIYKENSDGGAQ